jgi:rhodanese-related sulfurtransferase
MQAACNAFIVRWFSFEEEYTCMNCTAAELEQLRGQSNDAVLLDVRTEAEYAVASIEPSVHIPLHELEGRLDELDSYRSRPVVVICHHGVRSALAQRFLQQHGFENVLNLSGGIDAYAREVDPSVPRY